MATKEGPSPIQRVRQLSMALPEAEEKSFGGHTSPAFRIRDKMFAVVSEDGTTLSMKAPAGMQQILVGADPLRFFVPPYVGSKGWIGVRLDVDQDWDEMAELIEESYRMTAPKRLAQRLDRPAT